MKFLEKIENLISKTVRNYSKNKDLSLWLEPIVGCADASDPLFEKLKEAVSENHFMPKNLLPEAKSVIVYFIPFQKKVSQDNGAFHPRASRLWAEAYIETNTLISIINEEIKTFLGSLGFKTAVTPATHNFDTERLISWWSHKHIAYIAGLGTFGLNRLIITKAGCCGRLGSIVTDLEIPPTKRLSQENCLHKRNIPCGVCVKRCPVSAIEKDGTFDRRKCYEQLLENDRFYKDLPLVDVCGQCVSLVPCAHEIPKKA